MQASCFEHNHAPPTNPRKGLLTHQAVSDEEPLIRNMVSANFPTTSICGYLEKTLGKLLGEDGNKQARGSHGFADYVALGCF